MSYYIIKSLKLNEKENKISCKIADSSITDWNNKHIFADCEDLYKDLENFDEKKANFMFDVVCGSLQFENKCKYSKLVCSFDGEFKEYYIFCKNLLEQKDNLAYLKAYLEFKKQFDEALKPSKKEYVINLGGGQYLFSIKLGYYTQNGVWHNGFYKVCFGATNAKKTNLTDAQNILKCLNCGKIEKISC